MIEQIQRNFTSRIYELKEMNYYKRLKYLKVYSLERRRERYDLIYIYKTLKSQVPNVGINFKWSQRRGRTIVPPPVHKNSTSHAATLRRYSFRSRAAFLFNHLPSELRNIHEQTSMDLIKRKIDYYLSKVVDDPVIGR